MNDKQFHSLLSAVRKCVEEGGGVPVLVVALLGHISTHYEDSIHNNINSCCSGDVST